MRSEEIPTPEALRETLTELRLRNILLRSYGASRHRYELHPPLPEAEVEQWERDAGVRLPDEYRDFVIRFGNGGAGPDNGLLSLQRIAREFDADCPLSAIAQPFVPPHAAGEEIVYPAPGMLPVAHAGCGNMHVLVAAGPERGNMWVALNDGTCEPYWAESPKYPPQSTFDQRLAVNDQFVNLLLRDKSKRVRFWEWYLEWIVRCG